VGVGVYFWLASLKKPPEAREREERTYNVEVFDVEAVDLQEILAAFGTARADREVIVSAQVSGEVVGVHPRLKVGQWVDTSEMRTDDTGKSQRFGGDLLVQIDPKSYAERVAQATTRLSENRAALMRLEQEQKNNQRMLQKVGSDYETFKKEYERIQKLRASNAVTASQLARSLLELRQYEDAFLKHDNEQKLFPLRRKEMLERQQALQTDLRIAKLDVEHTEVHPPFSGSLSEVMAELGQYVRAGDRLVRLTDISNVEVPIPLTLTDYAKIEASVKTGHRPTVELAENENAPPRWTGHVVRVSPEADEETRTIKVYVHVENERQSIPLLPGTFVHARIVGPVLKNAISVPRDAIIGGRVFVAVGGRAEWRNVTIGQTLQSLAVISDGLASGTQVILTNLDVIHDGASLEIQSHRSLSDELKGQTTRLANSSLVGTGDKSAKKVN